MDQQGSSSDSVCWLCLCGSEAGELTLPCKCRHMFSHPQCLGRWQLQQAGREEEQLCRFCKSTLPSWTRTFLDAPRTPPTNICPTAGQYAYPNQLLPAMLVICNGKMVRLACTPTRAGAEEFKAKVQHIFNLDASQPLDVVFQMKVPNTSTSDQDQGHRERVLIEGFQAFEAAATVATICAAKKQQPRQPLAACPGAGDRDGTGKWAMPSPRSRAASLLEQSPRSAWGMRASTGSLPASSWAQPDGPGTAASRQLLAASSGHVQAAAGHEGPRDNPPQGSPRPCCRGAGAAGVQAKPRTLSVLSSRSPPISPWASTSSSPWGRRVAPLSADEAEDIHFPSRSSPPSSVASRQRRGSDASSGETPMALLAAPRQAGTALTRLLNKASTSLRHLFSTSGAAAKAGAN